MASLEQSSLKWCMLYLVVLSYNIFESDAHGSVVRRSASTAGSTLNISDIFIGRCNDYVQCTQPQDYQCKDDKNRTMVDCNKSLQLFMNAYNQHEPCKVPSDAYDSFLQESMIYTAHDETLFWSGTKELALDLATVTDRYTSIERTLAGYLLNNLYWCEGGIDDRCSERCPNGTGAQYQFWKSASRHFAAQATGFVSILLNASREGGAFNNTSAFATEELPNLNPDHVTHVYIHVVHLVNDDPKLKSEDCEMGSILTLKDRLKQRGLTYSCTLDKPEFIIMQCVEHKDAERCGIYYSNTGKTTSSLFMLIVTGIILYL